MPFGNGMGPNGAGPKTGRGLGLCSGYSTPGYLNGRQGGLRARGGGLGMGRGLGLGFGARRGYGYFQAAQTPQNEKGVLEQEIDRLSSTIDTLKTRLSEIDK